MKNSLLLACLAISSVFSAPCVQALPPEVVTVVMVHGAWADTSSWNGEIAALEARGFRARAVANPLHSLATDAGSVASFLQTVDGPVVLVGHSYGGSVISEAAVSSPNVKALVVVDGFLPEVGESARMLNGDGSALVTRPEDQLFDAVPFPDAPAGAVNLLLKRDAFMQNFANDLPPAQSHQTVGHTACHLHGGGRRPQYRCRVESHPDVGLHQHR